MSIPSWAQRFAVATALVSLLGTTSAADPAFAVSTAKAPGAAQQQPTTYDPSVVRLKLADTSRVGFNGVAFTGPGAGALNAFLAKAGARHSVSLFDPATAAVARQNAAEARTSGESVPDLTAYYRVVLNGKNSAEVAAQLKSVPEVAEAYVEPVAPPPPVSPSFVGKQTYQAPAPTGMGTSSVNNWPGALGDGVQIFDIEYSWNTAHEDLSDARVTGAKVNWLTPQDPFADSNHGTAVIGVLNGDRNAFGIHGNVPNASLRMTNANSVEGGWNVAAAITTATAKAVAGDVILLEQQTYGHNSELVPVEWLPDVYDAIRVAVAKKVNVVEAGANGSVNLSSGAYGTTFPNNKPNSGAILVGAGAACGFQPARSTLWFSNYGARFDLQGQGECVTTSGYGDLYDATTNARYTSNFDGTSSASPMVASAVAAYSAAYKKLNGTAASPTTIRADLVATGTAQASTTTYPGKIGPQPNIASAIKRTDLKPPTSPTGLTATVNSSFKPVLKWNASTDNVGIASYSIWRGTTKVGSVSASTLTYTDTSAARNTTYTYKIIAVDKSGKGSVASNTVTVSVK